MSDKDIPMSKAKEARLKAIAEVEEEALEKAIKLYKGKLRELNEAKVVVANIEREIKELELEIDQGNLPDEE